MMNMVIKYGDDSHHKKNIFQLERKENKKQIIKQKI